MVRGSSWPGLQDILSRTFVELHYSNCLLVFLGIAVLPPSAIHSS